MAGKYDGSILIDTKGDASGFNKMIGGMSGALKGFMGLIGAAFSVAAVVNFVKESVAEFNQLAEAQAKLTQVMRNTIQASDDEIRSIMGLIDAQEELGVVSADAQTAGAQELGTYLSLTSSLETLIPVLNDMAAQQLGIGASAESVTQIATMLGKVMEGQTSALSRYGYSFDAAQEKILKFGTEAQKAAVLAEVIGSSVGGMNEALAQTDAGRQFQLAQAFGQVKEQFGAAFSQISTLFIPALKVVAQALSVVANLARQAAQYVAMLFGKQLTTTGAANGAANTTKANTAAADSSNASAKSYDNMAGSASDAAKSEKSLAKATKDAGKAAKDALAPFDDLNVLQQEVATGSSGGGAGGVEDFAGVDGIGTGIVGIAEDVAMTGPFLEFMERLRALLEPLSKISLDNISEAFKKLKAVLAEGFADTLAYLEWFWYNILIPMAKWTVEEALPAFLNAVAGALDFLNVVVKVFRAAGIWLFNYFLKPIAKWTGGVIVDFLNTLGTVFSSLAEFIVRNQSVLLELVKILGSLALGIIAVKKASDLGKTIGTFLGGLGEKIIAFDGKLTAIASSIMAHPIIAALALLAGAIVYVVAKVNEANSQIDVAKMTESINNLQSGLEKTATMDSAIKRYRELTERLKDTSLSESAVAEKTAELNELRQWIIDNSNGVVTAEGAVTGAFDTQLVTLEKMTAEQRELFNIEALNNYFKAQKELPSLYAEQTKQREEFAAQLANETAALQAATIARETLGKIEKIELDTSKSAAQQQEEINALLKESGEEMTKLTGYRYDFYHTLGKNLDQSQLASQARYLESQADAYKKSVDVATDALSENQKTVSMWETSVMLAFTTGQISAESAAATLGRTVDEFLYALDETSSATATAIDESGSRAKYSAQDTGDAVIEELQGMTDAEKEHQKELDDLKKKAEDTFNSYAESTTNAFERIKPGKALSPKQLEKNLLANQKLMETYRENLKKLEEAGLDVGLLSELKDQGPEAAKQVQALVDSIGTPNFDSLNTAYKEGVAKALTYSEEDLKAEGGEKGTTPIDAAITEMVKTLEGDTSVSAAAVGLINASTAAGVEAAEDPVTGAVIAGTAWRDKVAEGIKEDTKTTTDKAAGDVLKSAIKSANTAINDEKTGAKTVGKNFDAGVAAGITSEANMKMVTDAIKKLADAMVKAFNVKLEISSPSKVGAEGGGFFVSGVAKGILGSISTAVSAVSALGGSIRDAMGDLDLVPKGFSDQLTNAFALASPTLPVPIMATGTIMTQGARMMQAASPAYAAAPGGWLQDEDGLRDLIREEVGDLVRHTGVYFKGPGAKIARALSPELDRESRRVGKKLVEGDA